MITNTRTLLFTFILAFTLLVAFVPQADASANGAAVVAPVHRRQANRIIKKRQLGSLLNPSSTSSTATGTVAGTTSTNSATDTDTAPTSTAAITTSQTTPTSSSTTSETSSPSTSSTPSTTTSSTTASPTTESTSSSTSSTPSTSSTSSTSSTQTTPTETSTSDTLSVTEAPDADETSSSDKPTSTVTNTASQAQESATESATSQSASTSVSKTTIIIIAVIGGCIVVAIILWTVIRKWKFRPSSEFEDRMNPIDWNPDSTHPESELGLNRATSNASSFVSGSAHSDSLSGPRTYNPRGNDGLVADLPNHDFTAGPANLGGGYADLQRGPSPAPQMSSVNRGPSLNRAYGY